MMQSAHPQMLQAVRNDGDDEALAAAAAATTTSDCHELDNQINAVAARRKGAVAVLLLLFIAFGCVDV